MALVLVCATFPLIWVGGLVTTYDAGMAVPDWPSTFGYNLFRYPMSTWIAGPWDVFIEHGHRLFASFVGVLTIALVVFVWLSETRRWVRWWAVGCLVLVVVQGLLAGARVRMDDVLLARIHGCVGPLFFTATVLMATFLSRRWQTALKSASDISRRTVRLAWIVSLLAYGQLVIGAHLRHLPADWTPQTFRIITFAHLIVALLLTAHLLALAVQVARHRRVPGLRGIAALLVVLTFAQIALGTATWTVKYGWPTWLPQVAWLADRTVAAESMTQAITVTLHVAMGSLIVAMSALLAARGSHLRAVATTQATAATDSEATDPVTDRRTVTSSARSRLAGSLTQDNRHRLVPRWMTREEVQR